MSDVVFKLVADPSQFIAGVNVADASQAKLNKSVEELGKDSKKAYDDAAKSTKGFGDETKNTETKTKSLKAQVRELKAELANATDPKEVERLARAVGKLEDQIGDASDAAAVFATDSPFEAVGNAVGSISTKLRNLDFKGAAEQSKLLVAASKSITFKDAIGTVKDLGTTLMNVGKALFTNPLFILAAAITAIVYVTYEAITAFAKLGTQTETLNKSLEDSKKNIEDLGRAQQEYMVKAAIANGQLTQQQGDRVRTELKQSQQRKDIAKKYAEDVKALAEELEVDLGDLQKGRFKENYTGDINNLTARKRFNKEALKLEKQLLIDSIVLARTQAQEKISILAEQNKAAEDKRLADQQKANEKYKQSQEAFKQALIDLEKRAQQKELEGLSGIARLEMQRKLANDEVKLLEESLIKKSIAAGKGNKLGLEQEAEFATLKKAINQEYYNGVLQLEIQAAQKKAQIEKNKNDSALANLELENTIVKNSIEAIRAKEGDSAREIEALNEEKHRMLLNQELSYQLEKQKLVIEGIEKEKAVKVDALNAELTILKTRTDVISQARVKAIEEEISAINLNSELAKAAAMSSVQNIVTGIQEELNKASNKPTIDYGKLLGLDNKEITVLLNAKFDTKFNEKDVASAKQAAQQIVGYLNQIMDAYFAKEQERLDKELSATQERIDSRTNNIENLEEQLNREKQLQDRGLANNVDRINKAIQEQEAARQKDLANEQAIKDEKKRLAKQQLDIDTATQASSLLVAAAQIYESYASIPYIGQALAAVVIAGMFAAFYTTRQSAYDNLNNNNFAKGVVGLKGPGTETSDDIPANLSLNESVITAKGTKKAPTLLKGLNADDNTMIEKGIAELLKNTGLSLSNIPMELQSKKQAIRDAEYSLNFSSNNKGVESKLDELRNEVKRLSNQESRTVLPDGRLMIKKGLNITYIKQRNG